jgi:phospholipase/carboxylesterase
MQAANNTELITFDNWTLRVRTSQSRSAHLLVLIHGWTGDENSMWIFARGLGEEYWVIAPRGPHPAETRGYSWRPPQPATFGRPSLDSLRPAAEALIRLVDGYSSSVRIEAGRFDVIGFSQGAALTNVLAMLYPDRVRKMGVLAGFVPSGMDAIIGARPLAGKQVFVAHGTEDELVPVDRARASIALLEQAGAVVTYCEDVVGHKVSAACSRALGKFLED